MKLHFIRHGRTVANESGRYSGLTDTTLHEVGIKQIQEYSKNGIYPPEADYYYTSALTRTIQTLNIIYPNVDYTSIKELNEIDFGIYENQKYEEVKKHPEFLIWQEKERFTMFDNPNGENFDTFFARISMGMYKIFMDMIEHNYSEVAIISHGAVISVVMEQFYKLTDGYYGWLLSNGRGYTLTFDDKSIKNISTVEDTKHIKAIDRSDI